MPIKPKDRPRDLEVPEGLQEFLQAFVVAILRNKPEDLLSFAADYFTNQVEERQEQEDRENQGGGGTLPGLTGAFRPGENTEMENDDEERMDDEEEMIMRKKMNYSRRKSVAAEGYDPDADDSDDEESRVVHAKTDSQRDRLEATVAKILLFKSLDKDQMSQVLDAMFEKVAEDGDHIIDEGDDGDFFYVIESGMFDIFKKIGDNPVPQKLGTYENKGSFGELALMYNAPRAATIVAVGSGSLWAMDRQTFRKIVVKATAKKRRRYEEFLKKVEVLSVLKDEEVTKVADAIETREFNDQVIINQGDNPDYFYIVVEGKVEVKRRGDDRSDPTREILLTTLGEGQYFGELAFLTKKPRAATVYACGEVKCACLDVQAFERLLGPHKRLMERNMELYEKQLASIAEGLAVD